MEAKEYLKQLRKIDTLIQNKMVEREQWRSMALNVTPQMNGERVQSSGNQQKMADAIHSYVDIEKELDRCIDEFYDKKREILATIEQLNATEYDILHKVYVQQIPLEDVAKRRDKSYSWATTVHGRALQNVQKILNEKSL